MDFDLRTVPALCEALNVTGKGLLLSSVVVLVIEEGDADDNTLDVVSAVADRRLLFSFPIATEGDLVGKLEGGPYLSISLFLRRIIAIIFVFSAEVVVLELDGTSKFGFVGIDKGWMDEFVVMILISLELLFIKNRLF